MKRLLLCTVGLLLASCATHSVDQTYRLDIDASDTAQRTALAEAARNVVQRQLDNLGVAPEVLDLRTEGEETLLDVGVEDAAALDVLQTILTDPWTVEIMRQTDTGSGDVVVEGLGAFTRTGIDNDDFMGVEAGVDPSTGMGEVALRFTEDGRAALQTLFASSVGKNIGIFVNERLVSRLSVESPEVQEFISIRGVPDPEMAEVFADDVNVGLHVTFTPVP